MSLSILSGARFRLLIPSCHRRGINDYTALHMAVGERNLPVLPILIEAGADPRQRTRIDDYETPRETAQTAGFDDMARLLAEYEARLEK